MLTTQRTRRVFNRACCDRTAGTVPCAMFEMLEGRQMMSAAPHAAVIPLNLINPVLAEHKALKHVNAKDTANVLPLKITSVTNDNGQLLASGTLGGQAFTAPVTLSIADPPTAPTGTAAAQAVPATPILDLSLGPIHLDVLGLKVDTSKICLKIAAQPGNGNLLGKEIVGAFGLGGFEEGQNPAALALEWGVRRLGERLTLRSRAGREKPVVADFFPAYDDDGGLLVALAAVT